MGKEMKKLMLTYVQYPPRRKQSVRLRTRYGLIKELVATYNRKEIS